MVKFFESLDDAYQYMVMKNHTARDRQVYCLVDGPEDNFAVVDLKTAIDLEVPYEWQP